MAYIDKTYIKSYAQYREVADWCKAQGTVTDTFGNKITPYNYIPHMFDWKDNECVDLGEYTEEYINEWLENIRKSHGNTKYQAEIPLWNTDHVFDIYLIKNCPIDFIQERLKEQYGGGWSKEAFTKNDDSYEAIKNGTSVYDTFVRNGEKHPHFKIYDDMSCRFKDDDICWWINVDYDGESLDYDRVADKWYFYNECYMPLSESWTNTSACDIVGSLSKRKLYRLLKKWNLPKGSVLRFSGDYKRHTVKDFKVVIK